jgi:hypothetical protein
MISRFLDVGRGLAATMLSNRYARTEVVECHMLRATRPRPGVRIADAGRVPKADSHVA